MRKAAPSLMMTFAVAMVASSDAYAEIAWQTNLRTAHAQAQSEGKLLLLHFYSDNCSWCEKLEKGAFQEPLVGQAISESFVPVKVHSNSSPKLAEMFKVTKFPTDVIVTTDGKTLAHTVSPQSPDRYVSMLKSSTSTIADVASAPPVTEVATAPSMPETQPATAPSQAPTAASSVTASYPVPGYATSAAPQPTATASIESPQAGASASAADGQPSFGLTLPSSVFAGTEAQLAGSRGLSFEMPSADPPAGGTTSKPAAATDLAAESTAAFQVTDSPTAAAEKTADATTTRPTASKHPELAMQGFCPVTVIRDDKWVEGKPEFGVIHLGKLYLFTSEENMQTFLNDPVPYTPVLNEIDAVVFFEERRIVPGKREWGLKDPIYNRMFFFADEASMSHFYNQYERYTKAAIEVMDKAVRDANPGT